jgi:hypothetical protein
LPTDREQVAGAAGADSVGAGSLAADLFSIGPAAGDAEPAGTTRRPRSGSPLPGAVLLGRGPRLLLGLAGIGAVAGVGLFGVLNQGDTEPVSGQRALVNRGPAAPPPSEADAGAGSRGVPDLSGTGTPPAPSPDPSTPAEEEDLGQQLPDGPMAPEPVTPGPPAPAPSPPPEPAKPPAPTRDNVATMVNAVQNEVDQAAGAGRLSQPGRVVLLLKIQTMRVVLATGRDDDDRADRRERKQDQKETKRQGRHGGHGQSGGQNGKQGQREDGERSGQGHDQTLSAEQRRQLLRVTDRLRSNVDWLRGHRHLTAAGHADLARLTGRLDRLLRS